MLTTDTPILDQIPKHILSTLQEMLGRIGEFNQTVERMRGIGARFGAPGRYEYEFRTEKEATLLEGPQRFLARFEAQCVLKGIDPQRVYQALLMTPHVLPWSDAARKWR